MSEHGRHIPEALAAAIEQNIMRTAGGRDEFLYCKAQIGLLTAYERSGGFLNQEAADRALRTFAHFQVRMRG